MQTTLHPASRESLKRTNLIMSLPSSKPSGRSLLPWGWRSNLFPPGLQTPPPPPSFCPTLSLAFSTQLHWTLMFPEHSTLLILPEGCCTCSFLCLVYTQSHPLSIYPQLVNSVSSTHLLWEAYPDCHSWSTPPLFPFCCMGHMATFLLLHLFM